MTTGFSDIQLSFRDAMGSVCTPVAVVTTTELGVPHGTTVSAFISLSMSPPMVLVSLDSGSELLSMVRRTGKFGVNVLSHLQSDLALRFARKGHDKFSEVEWTSEHGVARLPGSASWVACSVAGIVEGGDHFVLLGHVLGSESSALRPLTYHARTFGTHVSTPAAS